MTKVIKYADSKALAELCNEIDMPEEISAMIMDYAGRIDLNEFQPYMDGLLSMENGLSAAKAISEQCKKEQNGIKELTIHLIAALKTKEIYIQKQMNHPIYIDTMKIFSRFVKEHKNSYGYYGFDRGWWTYRVLNSSLFRLGQLEFEMINLQKDIDYHNCKIGDPVISIHIPSDAILTNVETCKSFSFAKEFFPRYFKETDFRFIFCYTWLLSPALRTLLSPSSNIVLFQDNFQLFSYEEDDDNFMEWVYHQKYDDYSKLPEDTTLQRGIKQHLLGGGKIGCGYGILV